MQELSFDAELISIPFTVGKRKFVLREASGDAVCKYRNQLLRSTKMVDGKVVGMEGMADCEPVLIANCAVEITPEGEKVVAPKTVRDWPNKVQKTLFARLKEISELDDKETVEGLEAQIDALQAKLARLRGANGQAEDPAKNVLVS